MIYFIAFDFILIVLIKLFILMENNKTKYKICHPELSSPYANSWKGIAHFLSIPSGSFYSAEINGFL